MSGKRRWIPRKAAKRVLLHPLLTKDLGKIAIFQALVDVWNYTSSPSRQLLKNLAIVKVVRGTYTCAVFVVEMARRVILHKLNRIRMTCAAAI